MRRVLHAQPAAPDSTGGRGGRPVAEMVALDEAGTEGPQAGFTLVEILVTLVIVGLAAALALRSATGGASDGRRTAHLARTLRAEIGLLRAQALRSGQATRLAFDPRSGHFLSSRPGAPPIRTRPLPVAVEAGAAGEIRFLADGGSSGGRIAIGGPGGGTILSVGGLTGQIRQDAPR